MAHLIANRDIPEGNELTICYGPPCGLAATYGFECACNSCVIGAAEYVAEDLDGERRHELVKSVMGSLQ